MEDFAGHQLCPSGGEVKNFSLMDYVSQRKAFKAGQNPPAQANDKIQLRSTNHD